MESEVIVEESESKTFKETIIDTKKTFKDLGICDELCGACTKLGYKHPTKIQAEAIPYALQCITFLTFSS